MSETGAPMLGFDGGIGVAASSGLAQASAAAARAGLSLDIRSRPSPTGDLFVVTVSREAPDWSMPPVEIAMAKDPEEAARRAITAIAKAAPRLNKQLATLGTEPPDTLPIVAGVSSDGVVSTLRVERDGAVRLAPLDIEAIADAVAVRLIADLSYRPRPKAKA